MFYKALIIRCLDGFLGSGGLGSTPQDFSSLYAALPSGCGASYSPTAQCCATLGLRGKLLPHSSLLPQLGWGQAPCPSAGSPETHYVRPEQAGMTDKKLGTPYGRRMTEALGAGNMTTTLFRLQRTRFRFQEIRSLCTNPDSKLHQYAGIDVAVEIGLGE